MKSDPPHYGPHGSRGFLRNAARVAAGHVAGYSVVLAVSPLLARMYGPEAFGLFAVYVLAVSCLAVIGQLRLDQALPMAESTRAAAVLAQLAIASTCILAGMLLMLAWVWEQSQILLGGVSLPELWAPLLAVGVVCVAIYQLVAAWQLRTNAYHDLAGMRVVFAFTMAATQLAIPMVGGSRMLGLPAGQAVGFAAGALFGAWRIGHRSPTLEWRLLVQGRRTAWHYRQFAVFGMPAALLSQLGIHAPTLILAVCYDLEVAGMFALAQRVFITPLTLLTNSFSRVFFAEATRQPNEEAFQDLFRTTLRNGVLLASLPVTLIALFSPSWFGFLFGSEWASAGWTCTLLAPMVAALAISQIVTPVFDLTGRQRQRLSLEALCTSLIAGGLVAAALAGWPSFWAIGLGAAGGTLGYTLLVLVARRYAAQFGYGPAASTHKSRLAA